MSSRKARIADLMLIYGSPPQPLPMPRTRLGMTPIGQAARQSNGMDWIYAYWDRDHVPLYVGISFDAHRRAQDHRGHADWWRFVAFGGAMSCAEDQSQDIEKALIQRLRPIFNDKHPRLPWSTTIEYLAWRESWTLADKYIGRIEMVAPVANPGGQVRTGLDRRSGEGTVNEEEQGYRDDDPDLRAHLDEAS